MNVKWSVEDVSIDRFKFPSNFLWGAATSSHQVEGNCDNNDWTEWEKSYNKDGFPRVKNGQKSGSAVEHWKRYKEDIQLLKDLGCNSYRFSVEWSKIEPRQGEWDLYALEHYQEVCKTLKQEKIIPFVTLHHFTNPIWIWNKGGFENPDTIQYFTEYVYKVGEALGHWVDYWGTINEPTVYSTLGWLNGIFPPGKKDVSLAARVLFNILKAHAEAFHALHDIDRFDADGDGVPCRVGIVKSIEIFDPARRWFVPDWYVCKIIDRTFNQSTLDAIQTGKFIFKIPGVVSYEENYPRLENTLDWIGLNYYTQKLCKFDLRSEQKFKIFPDKKLLKTDMGWAVYPQGLYRALKMVNTLGVPIYITENGLANDANDLREKYILDHIDAVNEAIADGIDVRGYFYWSLMDNFEWAEGFDKRFGLYHVNYKTQQRTLKEGSEVYREIIAASKKQST